MVIFTKDYGLKAYLVLKYNAVITNDDVSFEADIDELTIKREYITSEFALYNDILRTIIKKS